MFGVRISPPKGSIQPKPMSSMTTHSTFGAPSGADGGIGNAGSESSHVRPTSPGNRSPSRYVFIDSSLHSSQTGPPEDLQTPPGDDASPRSGEPPRGHP